MIHVLDTSVLLQGGDMPPGQKVTTPEAAAEVSPGGRDGRRFGYWLAAGLEIRPASAAHLDEVDTVARAAGNLGRLSPADRSLLALALDLGAMLWSDDNTVLDVASRLGLKARAVRDGGVMAGLDWRTRCRGCGRWDGDAQKPCHVCGSEVRSVPDRPGGLA